MWGICLNADVCNGNLFQRIVEYKINQDNQTVTILQPVNDINISIRQIKTLDEKPTFVYGQLVSPVNHPETIGKIETIIWHFKNNDFNFYISVDGKKKSKRYYSKDLIMR